MGFGDGLDMRIKGAVIESFLVCIIGWMVVLFIEVEN